MEARLNVRRLVLLNVAVALLVAGAAAMGWALWAHRPTPAVALEEGALLVVERQKLRNVDLAALHAELIPSWVVSRGAMRDLQFAAVVAEAEKDPNLGAILRRMQLLAEADPVLNASELLGLVATWNAYLDAADAPWRMEGDILVHRGDDLFALRTYRVIHDGETRVGKHTYRTRLQRRADDTTQMESYLGHVHSWKDGVLLLHDRIRDYALDDVWTLLDADNDLRRSPVKAAFAEPLRQSVREALGDEATNALVAGAPHRVAMMRVVAQVHSRHQCGSQFLISRVPWNGFEPADVARLQVHAAAAARQTCPDVTPEEAEVLVTASQKLQRASGLRDALDRLVAWVAGAVVIHEARHAADDDGRNSEAVVCTGCPSDLERVGVLEASAYVASFAAPGRGVVSMMQACSLDAQHSPVRVEAVSFLMSQLGASCLTGPPPDLVERARGLEVALFGRLTPVDLLEFPVGLPASEAR